MILDASQTHAPLVSVIIPCYNQARFLPEAVHSLQAQTYQNWECLIINDGSTDETAKAATALVAADSRLRLISQPNRGLAGARNRGLAEARGEFIQFLDSDDVIAPTKLEQQVSAISSRTELALAYCDYYKASHTDLTVIGEEAYTSPLFNSEDHLKELALRWESQLSIPCHCFLFDARFFTQHDIRFDESLPNHEDWDCWMCIFALKPKVHCIPAKLVVYRLHPEAMSRKIANMRRGFLKAIAKQRALFSGNEKMLAVLERKRRETESIYREHAPLYPARRVLVAMAKAVLPENWIRQLRKRKEGSTL